MASPVFVSDARRFTLRDTEGRRVLFPQSVTASLDGVALDSSAWTLHPEGLVEASESLSGALVLSAEAGVSASPPVAIAWAAKVLARQYAIDLVSRVPDRALSVQNDYGTVPLAQAGGLSRPTSLPEVNAVLNRHRHRTGPNF